VLPEGVNAVAVTAVGRNGAASKPVALAVPTPRR